MAERNVFARQRTGARILDAACNLFNVDGTSHVTTNHIAAGTGISPGNLYYWYSDKQQIIRALWARYATERGAPWEDAGDIPAPEEMLTLLAASTDADRAYAFLARDLLGLVHTDPELRAAYLTDRERRLTLFTALARSWRTEGLIRFVDDAQLADLVQILWILTESWWPLAALTSDFDPDPADCERLLRTVLEPYLPPERRP